MDEPLDFVSIALVVLPVLDWLAVALLWRARRRAAELKGYYPPTLDERGVTATLIATGATIVAVLGINRVLHGPLPQDWAVFLLVVVVVIPSLANIQWMYKAIRGDFDLGED